MLDTSGRVGLPIDPRIEARLLAVRRDGRRGRRRVVAAAGAVTVIILLAWGAGRSPLLAVRHVQLSGTGPTTRDAALAAAGLDRHAQMLDLNLWRMGRRLEALPWVDRAVVRRRWPSTVRIALTSRVPVAQVPGPDGRPAVVDARGRVLAVGPEAAAVLARPATHLPRLSGVDAAGGPGTVLAAGSGPALTIATAVPPLLAGLTPASQPGSALSGPALSGPALGAVVAGRGGVWSVVLSTGISVLFGSPDGLGAKLVALRTILAQVPLAGVASIDVRVPDTPVLTRGIRPAIVSTIPRG